MIVFFYQGGCTYFTNKNNHIPFIVERCSFVAAVKRALLYECEDRLLADLRPVDKLYSRALKNLLSNRSTTCDNLRFAEARESKFFNKMLYDRSNMADGPLKFVMNLATCTRYGNRPNVLSLLQEDVDDIQLLKSKVWDDFMTSQSSRKTTYREINPGLFVHCIHVSKHTISEHEQVNPHLCPFPSDTSYSAYQR